MEHQKQEILDQFTKQAKGFASASAIGDERALELLLAITDAGPDDTVLDVACGPGIVACAFARQVRHATGIDIVPAMIEQARSLQKERELENLSWDLGDVTTLPYTNASFSIVTSRYSFHHLENPAEVLSEMVRVCKSGGKVALIDVVASENPQKAKRFNQMEKLRDPSHVRALPLSELKLLFKNVGLPDPTITHYNLELELESFLQRSFPEEENEQKVRSMILEAVEEDHMGIQAYQQGDTIKFMYPIAILVSRKST